MIGDYYISRTQYGAVIQIDASYMIETLEKLAAMHDRLLTGEIIQAVCPRAFPLLEAGEKTLTLLESLPVDHYLRERSDGPKMKKGLEVLKSSRVTFERFGKASPPGKLTLEILVA